MSTTLTSPQASVQICCVGLFRRQQFVVVVCDYHALATVTVAIGVSLTFIGFNESAGSVAVARGGHCRGLFGDALSLRRRAHFDAYSSQHHDVRLFVSSTNQKETKQDVYQTLGVSWNANMDEIKTAYRTLAKKWHPGE